ncbi:Similar to tr/Q8YTV1/Q8YTV1 (fragment) [Microcystis aeruginosa PCC 9443]|uniref:Similar to tr/Q8YTV1/Q8YTV1 n=1 Tax=Microcystis aeruginosa PCC 9443 TaxID=1160281 RepID=I4G9X5_MICAE
MNQTSANYDEPWKEALTEYFEAFLCFFFPEVHQLIDWTLRRKNVSLTNSIKFGYSVEKKSGF